MQAFPKLKLNGTIRKILFNLVSMHVQKYKAGLVVGLLMALFHLVWSVLVITGVAQVVLDWVYKIHFLNNPFLIQPFDLATAGLLLVVTFVVGFVFGWFLGLFFNILHKK